ncbi:radical SAM protein [Acetivibrio clariflavus]|uniref:Putative Fe-S oxidoreductase n=1 Tax=Acetivibrio clariflavus (strain DSM 19732 / NBRC 101661 / EBR45) TaxID=720554 RepID=G8LUP3_ACECE|nr:radical SAM protein [Acetivibrio clariflavus]AEV67383.1 putative Fe-S oxidoreductase [Acetivibrio clariflavus DSM 19732]
MKTATKDYIINTVYRTNILPVISACNTSCVFCSHRQNPEKVEVYKLGKLDLCDFEDIIEFLSPDRKIIIGESATRIIEGEPLLHKNFIEIVEMVRNKYKNTPIQITTNGILLNERLVNRFVELGGIELNVSINSIRSDKRKEILGLKKPDDIKEKLSMLNGRINYSASAVFDPNYMEYEEIEEMTEFLDKNGANSIRLFLPGYTYLTGRQLELERLYNDVCTYVKKFKHRNSIPVIIEPSYIFDLKAKIEGVVNNSAAKSAGIQEDDIIVGVNGEKVLTRVDAFNKVFRLKNPQLDIIRGDKNLKITLKKEKNTSPGFIMLYDIDPDEAERVRRLVERYKANHVLFITSELAYGVLKSLFEAVGFTFNYDIIKAPNAFFGGTIKCAGLLTVQDIIESAKTYIKEKGKPDLIVLPPIMFDNKRRDLLGRKMDEIESVFKIPVDMP